MGNVGLGKIVKKYRLALILLGISLVTHLMWLGYPSEVVFDEVHFGKFVTAYCCTGERFFDIHPPHAKLLIAGMTKLWGYQGGLVFENIGQSYGDISPVGFRLWPALWGAGLAPLLYILMRQLGASKGAAFLLGLLVVFDNALTVQTRIMVLDGLLLLGIFGSLSAYLAAEKRLLPGVKEGKLARPGFWAGWIILGLAGILAGLAVGTKFTGLTALGVIGVIIIVRMWQCGKWREVKRYALMGLVVAASALAVYAAGWAIHFSLLDKSGGGDAWRIPTWESPLIVSFYKETAAMHKIMLSANYGLGASHPDASQWWSWPMMKVPVYYWGGKAEPGWRAGIYLLGNPVVWWGGSMLFITAVLFGPIRWLIRVLGRWSSLENPNDKNQTLNQIQMTKLQMPSKALWIPLVGYVMAYGPLIRVPRVLFLYHYLIPLIFSLMFGILWLDKRGAFKPKEVSNQAAWYFVVIGLTAAVFVIFSPLTYGFAIPEELYNSLFLRDTWP